MRIKRLDIAGFKSFVDATTLTFPDEVTAIVGPNGCGKSNIVDAIRWVMGEQSAKHLRGRAMEDVIFSGSDSRGPAALAEVSLTFDAEAMPGGAEAGGVPWGAVRPSEVKVTRRLFRDGTSEYLLNGVPCRLRDIVEFFLGTGVGSKAYAIIEQGRIGFIVSSKPEDRRGLIDEAAGITKYKAKKRLAERRMEATRQHLLRATDILTEIESRLRSLRLQAQKAERYKRYRAELRDLELWAASQRFLGFLAEEKSLDATRASLEEEHRAEETRVLTEEADASAERLALTEEMAELAAAKDELFALSNKADLAHQRAQHYEDECASLRARAEAADQEIADLVRRTGDNTRAAEALAAELGRFGAEADAQQAAYEDQARSHEELKARLAQARAALDESGAVSSAALARAARLESEIEATALRREDLRRRLEAATAETQGLEAGVATLATEGQSLEATLSTLAERQHDVRTRRAELDDRVTALKGEVARGELELETLREESHRRRSRLQSLEEIQSRYESFQRGVRAIMKQYRDHGAAVPGTSDGAAAGDAAGAGAAAQGAGTDSVPQTKPWSFDTAIRGLVADIVQPPPELEAAVEAVLGDRLGNIIVESQDVGVDAIEFLKERSEGRSSFIPLALRGPDARGASSGGREGGKGGDGGGGLAAAAGAVTETVTTSVFPEGEGVRGPMLELIGYDPQYHTVAAYLLGDVVVCENLKRALELWRRTETKKTIVTLDGEVIDPSGVVTGGSRESAVAGVLGQKREIRDLEELVARIEADRETALGKLVSFKQDLAEVNRALEAAGEEARDYELLSVGQRKDLERVGRELRQQEGRREQLARTAEELQAAIEHAEARLGEGRAGLSEAQNEAAAAEGRAIGLRGEVAALAQQAEAAVAALTTLKVAASQAEERRRAAEVELGRLARERDEHEQRRARLAANVVEERARAETLAEDASRLREEASLSRAEAEARARVQAEREEAVEERNGALSRREADLRAARQAVARMAQELSGIQLRCQEAQLRRTSLEEHIQDRYRDVTLAAVVYDHHLRPPVGEADEERMSELRGLIERMGEINLTAIEESAELQKRYDFLTTQKADLESAIAQLESAIEKINRASRRRFREVFEAVNAKFQEVFPRCFGGGRARLQLTDESDMLETGVEIIANPPGKKIMQNIELLSGGEKAMTAVALLFAIFLVKPSPFCLLDEVDAPLDEANVGRFNELVRAMTDRSQFIIITHNRRTMEIADRLCGITMEEPGVSKLVAVNLRRTQRGDGGRPRETPAASEPAPPEPSESVA